MADLLRDGQALSYRTLLAVAEAIVSHRDLQALFHDLAGWLQQVVGFDYLALLLHDAASDTLRLHLLESAEPLPAQPPKVTPVEGDPMELVLQTQKPLILSTQAEAARWPSYLERVKPFGVHSLCGLPLTTARRRLGALVFGSRQGPGRRGPMTPRTWIFSSKSPTRWPWPWRTP